MFLWRFNAMIFNSFKQRFTVTVTASLVVHIIGLMVLLVIVKPALIPSEISPTPEISVELLSHSVTDSAQSLIQKNNISQPENKKNISAVSIQKTPPRKIIPTPKAIRKTFEKSIIIPKKTNSVPIARKVIQPILPLKTVTKQIEKPVVKTISKTAPYFSNQATSSVRKSFSDVNKKDNIFDKNYIRSNINKNTKQANSTGHSSGGITQSAHIFYRPSPAYPAAARRMNKQGIVTLNITVGTDGKPKAVKIIQPASFSAFNRAALQAGWAYRFNPAMKNGVKIQSSQNVQVIFRLQ